MIRINDSITIRDDELIFDFVCGGGPGGQKVNKTSSAVILKFNVNSTSLPDDVRKRLIEQSGNRISADGILIIHARRFRSQIRNREDAIQRLVELLLKAAKEPAVRKETKSTRSAREKRLHDKKAQSTKKKNRSFKPDNEDC